MKKFLILHYGFEKPEADAMAAWNDWFALIEDRQIEKGHLPGGREITREGTRDLPFGRDSITGYTMIRAESLEEAESIAQKCPVVDATRVYEIMPG